MFLPQQAHFALSVLMNLFVFILFLFNYICNIMSWLTLSKPKNNPILGLLIVNLVYILVMYQNGYKKAHPFFGCALFPLPSLSYISSLSRYLNVPSLICLRTSLALSPYQPYSFRNRYRYFVVVCE